MPLTNPGRARAWGHLTPWARRSPGESYLRELNGRCAGLVRPARHVFSSKSVRFQSHRLLHTPLAVSSTDLHHRVGIPSLDSRAWTASPASRIRSCSSGRAFSRSSFSSRSRFSSFEVSTRFARACWTLWSPSRNGCSPHRIFSPICEHPSALLQRPPSGSPDRGASLPAGDTIAVAVAETPTTLA